MNSLTNRTNAVTGEPEMWWGPFLQIDETRTSFQSKFNNFITHDRWMWSLKGENIKNIVEFFPNWN